MQHTVFIHDRNYTSWSIDPLNSSINPSEHKLLNGDIIEMSNSNTPTILTSPVRQAQYISGVLMLEGNKTYGRTENKKRLLYRVVPQQKYLPHFLVPYDIKASFNKAYKNKYVLFRFDHWNDKHPRGILTETLGDVDQLEAFYEYQLYSKSLNGSIKEMTKQAHDYTKSQTVEEYMVQITQNSLKYKIEDRTHVQNIITIDPKNSIDYDDALSVQYLPNNQIQITVYFANVFIWLETFHLWNAFSNRVATVYLPDRRRPMLPNIVSDSLCSLVANGKSKFAIAVDFYLNATTLEYLNTQIHSTMIQVHKNFVYEDPALLHQDITYKNLLDITSKLSPNKPITSHHVVSYWMVQANTCCAKYMSAHKIGVYRTVKSTIESVVPPSAETEQVIQNWISCSGQYSHFEENTEHLFLKIQNYLQITSPIRRLVDLLNQMILCQHKGDFQPSEDATQFIQRWMNKLDYINASTRSIRKLQADCSLLHKVVHHPEFLNQLHQGIVFDKLEKNNGCFGYMVYLEELKLLSRITTPLNLENHSKHVFKVFLFENEDCTKKKIRVSFA
jgi:exoribonuclease R